MNNYWDTYGRLHHKPVTAAKPFPSGNSFLYSGEASLIGVPVDKVSVLQCYKLCATEYGYNRNPDGDTFPNSSHDEICGLFMLMSAVGGKALYEETKNQHFQVCNLPDFKPVPLYKLNPFKVARDFWQLSREENPRKATHKYPYIYPLTFRHLPQHSYFYARCAGVKPNLLHTLWFVFASLFTIFLGDNSSKVMLNFKLLKLDGIGMSRLEKFVGRAYLKKVNVLKEVEQYFPADHPITIRLNELADGK